MRLYRIGEKVVSREKLLDAVEAILTDREDGATQEEAARENGVQRSFVSFLETLGEVRRGGRIAVVGFPIANVEDVRELCGRYAVDFSLVLSQGEREDIEAGSATQVFNMLLDTLAELRDYDVVVLLASDWRIQTMERILGTDVIGLPLGPSPIREDRHVDLGQLEEVLATVAAQEVPAKRGRLGRTGSLRDAEKIVGGWRPSRKS
ncbi:MAG: transcriptional regulator [Coriobacteriales bacterium]|nr:transcriptional regulator [Coriobacteriales bacterium]